MVEGSDRAPLLDWEEIHPGEPPQEAPSTAPVKDHASETPDILAPGSIGPGIQSTVTSEDLGGVMVSSVELRIPEHSVRTPQHSVRTPQHSVRTPQHSVRTPQHSVRTPQHSVRTPQHRAPGGDDPGPIESSNQMFPGISVKHRLTGWEEKDQIVAVFVVTFDTRSGNMVEWCLPQDVNLDGVEFKSMASGSHRIANDFIYFRKGCYFGMACFANMPVESELERGARMKSVGILSPSYTLLYRYMHFLENQVKQQLQYPGQYFPLEAFYEDKKAVLLPAENGLVTACPSSVWAAAPINRCMHPEMKITHPAGCMSQFIQFFGEQIMVLWKLSLLRKRILIFSPPPVGVVCYRVYCCCCLANMSIPGLGGAVPELRPFFYINVADISTLETELSYVACTTEKIFEEKKELYDVYVDNQNVKSHRDSVKPLLRLNEADKDKYRKLSEQRQMLLYSQEVNEDCTSNEEDLFVLFFMEQNNRIFQILSEVAGSLDRTLTAEHVRAMGLDPQGDRSFLVELLELYGIDAMLVIDNSCCH